MNSVFICTHTVSHHFFPCLKLLTPLLESAIDETIVLVLLNNTIIPILSHTDQVHKLKWTNHVYFMKLATINMLTFSIILLILIQIHSINFLM